MKVRVGGVKRVCISGEYIKLDGLLKLTAVVSSGGEAKRLIQGGWVYANGRLCRERGRKIRPGDIVRYGAETLIVQR